MMNIGTALRTFLTSIPALPSAVLAVPGDAMLNSPEPRPASVEPGPDSDPMCMPTCRAREIARNYVSHPQNPGISPEFRDSIRTPNLYNPFILLQDQVLCIRRIGEYQVKPDLRRLDLPQHAPSQTTAASTISTCDAMQIHLQDDLDYQSTPGNSFCPFLRSRQPNRACSAT